LYVLEKIFIGGLKMYTNRHRKLILKELERLWNEHPDLRLGQLIQNVSHLGDTYYLEDDELIELLKDIYKKECCNSCFYGHEGVCENCAGVEGFTTEIAGTGVCKNYKHA
jgi:hypothetical protein